VSPLFDLKDRVAFITGAAGGIGFAMAEVLAEHGATVLLSDIASGPLEQARARLAARGLCAEAYLLDASDPPQVEQAIASAAAQFGRLDILCANAGISAGPGPLTEAGRIEATSMERWDRVVRTNLTGAFASIRAAALAMRPQRRGRIIVTASVAGLQADEMCGYAYVAAKAGIINVTRQTAIDLAPDNIMVNAIAPGPILTAIGGDRLHQAEVAAGFTARVPLRRLGRPEELKGVTLLLASDAASFMTGTVIPVDGGLTAC
jgi:gluconate 5-dehydrogenase